MSIRLLWHGYPLTSTGSNLYSQNIARVWSDLGHTVLVLAQEHRLAQVPNPLGHARASERGIEWLGDTPAEGQAGCILVNSDIGEVLPVYVISSYPNHRPVRIIDLDEAGRDAFRQAQRAALRAVLAEWPNVEMALINHAVPGPDAVRPVFEDAGIPYTVKVHGSELEYALSADDSLIPMARTGLAGAARILAGSSHIVARTRELIGDEALGDRVKIVPPGVNLDVFAFTEDKTATRAALTDALGTAGGSGKGLDADLASRAYDVAVAHPPDTMFERLATLLHDREECDGDDDSAIQIERVLASDAPVVVFVGRFIPQKGPQLAISAMPWIRQRHPGARLVMVGFGPTRPALGALTAALDAGDLDTVRLLATPSGVLDDADLWAHVRAVLKVLDGDPTLRAAYLAGAKGLLADTAWTGAVGHDVLRHLWPLTDITLVPSIFPEAFGMVAAEAAACGSLPIVSDHTGLGEVGRILGAATGLDHTVDTRAVPRTIAELAERAADWLARPDRRDLAHAARRCVEDHWSWDALAEQAAAGRTAH